MRRFFVKNLLFVIAVNILVKPIWMLFIDRVVQNRVSGSYGTYAALLSVSIIFQTFLDFGISSYNSRTIAQNPDKLVTVFPAMLSARLLLIILYTMLAFGYGYAIGYRGWELCLLLCVLMIQSLNSLVAFIRSNVAALHRFKTDGILSVTDRLLMILLCGFLLVYPPTARLFRIQWFVIAQIVCYFISAAMGYLILRRIGKVRLRFSFDAREIFRIVKQSFPYALLILQMSVYNRADVTIMERICPDGKEQAGIWAAAFRLLDQANMFGLMFATILLPMFGRMLAQKHDVQHIVKLCVNMLLPTSFTIALAGIFFSSDIMWLLYHNNPAYTALSQHYNMVFAILIASFPSWCIMYVYSTLLTANGSMKTLNLIAFAGVVLNLVLNFALIPTYKAEGGAVTSFITQTALALTFMVCASRIASLPFNIKWMAAHVAYMALVLALAYGVVHLPVEMSRAMRFGLLAVISAGLLFPFRFVSVSALKTLAGGNA